MDDNAALRMFGWLVFAWGAALVIIAVWPRKGQVKSPARRLAGVLSGAVFCLLASIVCFGAIDGTIQKGLLIAAVVVAAASWYVGRHAHRMDKRMK